MTDLPEANFTGWYPWSVVHAKAGAPAALNEVGTYLLARFEGAPPAFDPLDKAIFYVGETHGRKRSLRARLSEFGCSAGFDGEPDDGHYAAWAYPKKFPDDVQPGLVDSSKVHVALSPWPAGSWPRVARGVFPCLIEAMLIWRYTVKHLAMPVLNNSGAGHAVPLAPPIDDALLRSVLTLRDEGAAADLLHLLAKARGYTAARPTWPWQEDGMLGLKRALGGKWWLQIGWHATTARVGFWVSNKDTVWFGDADDEEPAMTEEGLRTLIDRLWYRWHTEW